MVKRPIKVHLCGSVGSGYALHSDLATTQQALLQLPGLVQLTGLRHADVVYSVREDAVLHMDEQQLRGKRIVSQVCNDLMRIHEDACMVRAAEVLGWWVPMNKACVRGLDTLGYPYTYIPYAVDDGVYTDRLTRHESVANLRELYGIPKTAFVISNFMRDSITGDLLAPKPQKGADLLLEIGRRLIAERLPVHFLLAGPRRHWLRHRMKQHGIPFTYVGREMDGDDNKINFLPPHVINHLYHASDLHLITSRWEAGPRAVLESSATRTPILSTPVGMAPDILEPECLYRSVDVAIKQIERQICTRHLDATLDAQYQKVITRHVPEANVPRFRRLFGAIDKVPVFEPTPCGSTDSGSATPLARSILRRATSLFGVRQSATRLCICLWHEFHKPPYGGGNQFMMALRDALARLGVKVVINTFSPSVDVHICNSASFDTRIFQSIEKAVRMIHCIDGPTTLYRQRDSAEDDLIFDLNRKFASATVFQSAYCFKASYELGYRAVAPVVIHNSVDPGIFHARGCVPFDPHRKIRLISSALSDNPRKGGLLFKWLDKHLDWDRFEYTFVGRVKQRFDHIDHIHPQSPASLARLFRAHDIFISANQHEPYSNALLEALACGMPVLYRISGGNAELVSFAGLPFTGEKDVLRRLDRLVVNYSSHQRLIDVRSIEEVAGSYIALAEKLMIQHPAPMGAVRQRTDEVDLPTARFSVSDLSQAPLCG